MRVFAMLLVTSLLAAGCLSGDSANDGAADQVVNLNAPEGASVTASGHRGNTSTLTNTGSIEVAVTFPQGVLLWQDQRLVVPLDAVTMAPGAQLRFVPPLGLSSLELELEAGGAGSVAQLDLVDGAALFSGDLAVDLLQYQNDTFPNRRPGMENHGLAITYFADFMRDLGYEVEVNEYPITPNAPDPRATSAQSLHSVVAWKRGTSDRIIGMGGHFDVVEQTAHGAFDNTAGTVATMALAAMWANIETDHTLMFGLWSGEEDGILGSQAWVSSNPDLMPLFDLYINYDVTALAWPAPKFEPSGVVVTAGPDQAIGPKLHDDHAFIEQAYLQTGAPFIYESVAKDQATGVAGAGGSGVNAQSDHVPFMARGVPVYFQFTERVDDVFAIIHSETDNIDNLVKYSLLGVEGVETSLSDAELVEGRRYLADSFETQMALGLYYPVLLDDNIISSARPEQNSPGAQGTSGGLLS